MNSLTAGNLDDDTLQGCRPVSTYRYEMAGTNSDAASRRHVGEPNGGSSITVHEEFDFCDLFDHGVSAEADEACSSEGGVAGELAEEPIMVHKTEEGDFAVNIDTRRESRVGIQDFEILHLVGKGAFGKVDSECPLWLVLQ